MMMSSLDKVFVIHGRDEHIYHYLLDVLEKIGITTLPWEQAIRETSISTKQIIPPNLSIVKYALEYSRCVLVLMTPDEIVKLKRICQNNNEINQEDIQIAEQSRPNVIFELGMVIGLAKENQAIHIIRYNKCRSLSNIDGLNYISFNDDDLEGFLSNLTEQLRLDGFKLKEPAVQLAKAAILPKTICKGNSTDYSYLSHHSDDQDSIAVAIKERGQYGSYYEKILASTSISIIGVSQESILRNIRDAIKMEGSEFENIKEKTIRILLAGNRDYTNMIDKIESLNRNLYADNLVNALSLVELKSKKNLDKLEIRMHLFANSCTIMIFDDIMWITPYTHKGGNDSPTFIISKYENPEIYKFYLDYFDKLWSPRNSVLIDDGMDENSLIRSIDERKRELGLVFGNETEQVSL